MGYNQEVLADAPVGYWRLGEAAGSGTVLDSSGNGYTGTVAGGVTLGQPGAVADGNTAALFNGTTGYVYRTGLDPLSGATAITLEGWVNHYGVEWSGNYEMLQNWGGVGTYFAIIAGMQLGTLKISGTQRFAYSLAVPTSDWHHLAITWSSGDTIKSYLDGVPVGTPPGPYTGTLDSSPGLFIATFTGSSYFFNGGIDEVAIYPTALSAARIADHYRSLGEIISGYGVLKGNRTLKLGW